MLYKKPQHPQRPMSWFWCVQNKHRRKEEKLEGKGGISGDGGGGGIKEREDRRRAERKEKEDDTSEKRERTAD